MNQFQWMILIAAILVAAGALSYFLSGKDRGGRRRQILSVTLFLAAGIVLAGALLVARRAEVAAAPAPTDRPTPVQTETAERGDLDETRRFLGRVAPWQTTALSSRITARIVRLVVREGERVRKGELLVELDDEEVLDAIAGATARVAEGEARMAAQRAVLSSLKKSLAYWELERRRDTELVKEGAISQAASDATAERFQEVEGRLEAESKTLEALRKQTEAAKHRLEELRSRQAYATIRSPFDGIVARREADPGDLALPGKTLLVVEDHSRLRVTFDVPQDEMEEIVEGARVHLLDKDLELRVDRLYPSLNPDRTRTMEAYAPASAALRTGSFHSLEIVIRRFEDVTLIPEAALLPRPREGYAVFTVESGRTRSVPVRRLLVRDGVAAVEGLTAGIPVIITTYLGWNRLSEGEAVEVIQ